MPGKPAPALAFHPDCRVCGSQLFLNRERYGRKDDVERGVCAECQERPEGLAILARPPAPPGAAPVRQLRQVPAPREFNAAERALITNLFRAMPAEKLLEVINARAAIDAGERFAPFTLDQLQVEVDKHTERSIADGDWGGLRKLIARARREGLLTRITLQMVDDFSVVFRLSPAQHMRLRDVIKNAQEGQ